MDLDFDEFQFALEMIILNRNENGATLLEIRDDLENHFGVICENIWGHMCWEQRIRPMLTNAMPNISSKTLETGCILYYMDVKAAIDNMTSNLCETKEHICQTLSIDLNKLKKRPDENLKAQSPSTPVQYFNESMSSELSAKESDFCGILLIGDNFFLEMAQINLRRKLAAKSRIKQIGHCVSGQSIRKALNKVASSPKSITNYSAAVINLGTVDLLQGREFVDMAVDMDDMCRMLCDMNIFPIVTTLPPLANQMHNSQLEEKRKLFNSYVMKYFDCIDIESCFLTNLNRITFELYQREPRSVGGTRHSIVLWNKLGRQKVLKKLKRKIPDLPFQIQNFW